MSNVEQPETVAFIGDAPSAATADVQALLGAAGRRARWFAPHDADDVERAILNGAIRRVVFADLPAFLETLWSGRVALDRWQAGGVQIEFVRPPPGAAGDQAALIGAAWQSLRHRRRRRQIAAGLALSAAALAAACALLALSA